MEISNFKENITNLFLLYKNVEYSMIINESREITVLIHCKEQIKTFDNKQEESLQELFDNIIRELETHEKYLLCNKKN